MSASNTLKMSASVGLHSGGYLDLLKPSLADIKIEDIAHGLSQTCRFGGQCRIFYSVAQHCVRVSHHVPGALALPALLHDAAEAYIGDIVAPLKQLLPGYKEIEARLDAVILQRFHLDMYVTSDVDRQVLKTADLVALRTEQLHFMPNQAGDDWGLSDFRPMPFQPALDIPSAKAAFLTRFEELTS